MIRLTPKRESSGPPCSETSLVGCNNAPDQDGEASGAEITAATKQQARAEATMHLGTDDSSNSSGNSSDSSRTSSCSKRQCSGGTIPKAGNDTEESAAAADAAAVAIAAPTAKRETDKTTSVLRPRATNSTASTCSSLWESVGPRASDEPPSSSDGPTPRRTPKGARPASNVQQQHLQQQHQQERRVSAASRRSGNRLAKESSETLQETHKDSSCTLAQQKQQSCSSSSHSSKKADSEVEGSAEELSPPPATEAAVQQKHQQQTQQEQQTPQEQKDGVATEPQPSSSGNPKKYAVSEMAAHMVTRKCDGDGNCLYRAFSDQLYGSQDHHLFLRKLAVDVMMRCQGTFEAFVDESEGPFDRWLQAKRTYGEWADYREMHALLLLFGTPIFVFDEHLHLLQTFEPEEEKRKSPSPDGGTLTPFRLMWHGKLGHYTSLHYTKETFPIAGGFTIGELEAEGLARLILSLASGDSSTDTPSAAPEGPPAVMEDEALAKFLQVSAQELAGLAAEQELILAAIKKQRLQQLLPQTTRVVDALWHEAKEEQEVWTARLARGPRGPPLSPSSWDTAQQQHNVPWRVIERQATAPTTAAEGYAANVRTSEPPFRGSRGPLSAACCPPTAQYVAGRPLGEERLQAERLPAVPCGDSRVGQTVGYTSTQPPWQQQLRQQVVGVPYGPFVRRTQGSPAITSQMQGPVGTVAMRSPLYSQQYAPHREFGEQQRQCVRLPDGRLMYAAPSGPLRPATLQQRQVEQQQLTRGPTSAPAQGQRSNSSTSAPDETSWLMRWMGSSSSG